MKNILIILITLLTLTSCYCDGMITYSSEPSHIIVVDKPMYYRPRAYRHRYVVQHYKRPHRQHYRYIR